MLLFLSFIINVATVKPLYFGQPGGERDIKGTKNLRATHKLWMFSKMILQSEKMPVSRMQSLFTLDYLWAAGVN